MSARLKSNARPRRTAAEVDKQLENAVTERDAALVERNEAHARQAATAIENARLLTELRARTNDLQESLEYQTATSDVLKVISRSTFDLQPVLDTLMQTLARLCPHDNGALAIRDGDVLRWRAFFGGTDQVAALLRRTPVTPGRGSIPGRTVLEGKVVHILDIAADSDYAIPEVVAEGVRTAIGVPLLRDGVVAGVFTLTRNRVEPFTERQIELVRTFADQAVIAIENARLLSELRARTNDLQESLEYQTATSEVLKVISRSTFDLQPVLDTLVRTAGRLCNSDGGGLTVKDGDVFRYTAFHGLSDEMRDVLRQRPVIPSRDTVAGRTALEGQVVHLADLNADPSYGWRQAAALNEVRSIIGVPMLRDGEVVGTFSLTRNRVEPFTERQIELVRTFADQAVIAIENARLLTELRESLDRQTATAEILRAIASTPGDPTRALDTIAETAARMFGAANAGIRRLEGGMLHYVASAGRTTGAIRDQVPARSVDSPDFFARAARENRQFHLPDFQAEIAKWPAELQETLRRGDVRTAAFTPLTRDGKAIGAMGVNRTELRPFRPDELELMKGFADQAVIAIENARLLTELRERTNDLQESLEYQTATSDVLKVISRSTFDLQPVLDTLIRTAGRLCIADGGALSLREGDTFRYLASIDDDEFSRAMKRRTFVPGRDTMAGRVMLEDKVVHITDAEEDPGFNFPRVASRPEMHTGLGVPLLRDGVVVGAFTLTRNRVEPFTERQIELVSTFADQAVIAIENARLLSELRESLEYQTATSDVLSVINSSPGDLAPVFDAILDKAVTMAASHGALFLFDGVTTFRAAAVRGYPDDIDQALRQGVTLSDAPAFRPLVEGARLFHQPDLLKTIPEDDAVGRYLVEHSGIRTNLMLPLRKDNVLLGVISCNRHEVRPFADKEIALLENFAAQAVIAIENARLLTELRESLEQQQAMAEVLQVINASPGNLQPVFDAILDKAHSLCGANIGWLLTFDGELVRMGASRGLADLDPSVASAPFLPGPAMRRLIDGESFFQIPDISEATDLPGTPAIWRASCELLGEGNYLVVPLRKDGTVHGFINAFRSPIRLFTDKEIALLESFAAQAVIAMDNARLLTELRESLEQQQAIAEVLQVINASPGDLAPVYDAILEKAYSLCGAAYGSMQLWDGEELDLVGACGRSAFAVGQRRRPEGPKDLAQRLIAGESFVHVADVRHVDDPTARRAAAMGQRSVVMVPLRKESTLLGLIVAVREEVRPFTDKQIALLQSFAAQAVIAMDNARLLTELRDSLDRQTATAEILRAINSSPGDLAPVFDAILEKAHTLCGATRGSLFIIEGDTLRAAATRGYPADLEARLRDSAPLAASGGRLFAPLLDGARMVHHPDLLAIVRPDDAVSREVVARGGVRTNLLLPLRKDTTLLGFISCNRAEVRPFAEKEIALLESFAAQAVIAMDNARLLGEIRQRQAELRVTFENMGDAVIMFDGAQRLVAWNRNFQTMLDIPEEWLAAPQTYNSFAQYLTDRGEFGDTPPPDIGAPERGEVRPIRYERTRPDGRVLEVRRNPIPGGGGFVFIYADITERKRAEESILAAREAAEKALADLKLAQANLIQAEKMASLGALTAGIAHEIKNPLNFVNNFANLSNELLGELKETAAPAFATLDAGKRDEIDETMDMLTGNLEKIQEHGRRADGIVKSMLAHSRGGSGDRREADVNALVEESLNLAYHGARAQDQNFNITLERDYDKGIEPIELVPQDVTRVFLNLCGNGFYAANKRRKDGGDSEFRPVLKVATRELGNAVEVRIRDNGTGIPPEVRDKLFQPFFTTKPTGEGTGLGLSISYDIVTQQHGGTIAVDSRVGDFTEFTIRLPRNR